MISAEALQLRGGLGGRIRRLLPSGLEHAATATDVDRSADAVRVDVDVAAAVVLEGEHLLALLRGLGGRLLLRRVRLQDLCEVEPNFFRDLREVLIAAVPGRALIED